MSPFVKVLETDVYVSCSLYQSRPRCIHLPRTSLTAKIFPCLSLHCESYRLVKHLQHKRTESVLGSLFGYTISSIFACGEKFTVQILLNSSPPQMAGTGEAGEFVSQTLANAKPTDWGRVGSVPSASWSSLASGLLGARPGTARGWRRQNPSNPIPILL